MKYHICDECDRPLYGDVYEKEWYSFCSPACRDADRDWANPFDQKDTTATPEPAPASRAVVVSALRREILFALSAGASKATRHAAREHLDMLCTLAENAQ